MQLLHILALIYVTKVKKIRKKERNYVCDGNESKSNFFFPSNLCHAIISALYIVEENGGVVFMVCTLYNSNSRDHTAKSFDIFRQQLRTSNQQSH